MPDFTIPKALYINCHVFKPFNKMGWLRGNINKARLLMFHSQLPIPFWSYAILHAVHLINILPSKKLNSSSPFSIVHQRNPDLQSLRIFGSLCYATTIHARGTKFQSRARKCVLLGFKEGTKGYQ